MVMPLKYFEAFICLTLYLLVDNYLCHFIIFPLFSASWNHEIFRLLHVPVPQPHFIDVKIICAFFLLIQPLFFAYSQERTET